MARRLVVAAAQMGPIQRAEGREVAVGRMLRLMETAHRRGAEVVVFPALPLTTFFPRWHVEDLAEADACFESAMPSNATAPLRDRLPSRLRVGAHADRRRGAGQSPAC